jgi:hypothetical protein
MALAILISKKIERRTLNFQHRTSNIDGAALYRFKNKRITACDEAFSFEPFGREPFGLTTQGRTIQNRTAHTSRMTKDGIAALCLLRK